MTTIHDLNLFLQNNPQLNNQPLFVFITGASGVGKSYLAHALERELDPNFCTVAYFDLSMGVPPEEEMIARYGSGEK